MLDYQKPIIITFLGSLGSGKTFFARHLAKQTNIVRLNADAMRLATYGSRQEAVLKNAYSAEGNKKLFGGLNYVAKEIIATGESLIYDTARFNDGAARAELTEIVEVAGGEVILVWMKTDRDVAVGRAKTRDETEDQRQFDGELAESIMKFHEDFFDPPVSSDKVIVIDGTMPFEQQYVTFKEQLKKLL